MHKCIKTVVPKKCRYCPGKTIKFGKSNEQQRYRCQDCGRTQMEAYSKLAYGPNIDIHISSCVREGCGIRSIARLLGISPNTVINRIKRIASAIKKPPIALYRTYEVDEMKTYVRKKGSECWVTYALDRESGQVVDLKVGKRTKTNLKLVIDTLLLSRSRHIYTDRLALYGMLIPRSIHKLKRGGTNRIERKNLSVRTHLKRLNRRTICFSRSMAMLEACLKIYFWPPREAYIPLALPV